MGLADPARPLSRICHFERGCFQKTQHDWYSDSESQAKLLEAARPDPGPGSLIPECIIPPSLVSPCMTINAQVPSQGAQTGCLVNDL